MDAKALRSEMRAEDRSEDALFAYRLFRDLLGRTLKEKNNVVAQYPDKDLYVQEHESSYAHG